MKISAMAKKYENMKESENQRKTAAGKRQNVRKQMAKCGVCNGVAQWRKAWQ
jgi:hypothetical protein